MKEELIKHDGGFDQYYFVEPGSDYGEIMWRDIELLGKAVLFPNPLYPKSKLLHFLHHIHFSFAVNNRIPLPFQRVWRNAYALSHVKLEKGKKYCVIYTDISACRTDCGYLQSLNNMPNIVMVLVMANVVQSKEKLLAERFSFFDYIFSWDKGDAEKYGMVYHPSYYSRIRMPDTTDDHADCFFVGNAKGRLRVLTELYRKVTEAGGKADFYITGVGKKDRTEEGIHYNQKLPYSKVLEKNMNSNCIIEVLAGNQVGQTLRAEEAIIGNKKLLTNNIYMRGNPYYKTGYIRIFDEIREGDIRFILDKEKVDYHYLDDYSPIHLIDHINKMEEEKSVIYGTYI